MGMGAKTLLPSFLSLLIIQSCRIIKSHSKSIITSLPGYPGDLPFKLETGYVGIGEKEDVQLFYYFMESTRNANEDPLIFCIPGGPGASALFTMLKELGPLSFDLDNSLDNLTLVLNQDTWTQMANIIIVDIPAGTGVSYAETKEGNELGDQPTLNIQGYILFSPLTHKFNNFNSRFEYAHRMALISDDVYKSALKNCYGNYVNVDSANSICANSLQRYEECTSHINFANILDPVCDANDSGLDCDDNFMKALNIWANSEGVQQALNIRYGKIGEWEAINQTIHYDQGKNDTFCYSYDIFSSLPYHKILSEKQCRALIFSGDHDMTFPYVGVEQWITSLNLDFDAPWKPFYVDGQVGGYEMKYAHNDYSLTFATVKGAGHMVPYYKPKETIVLVKRWLSSQTFSDS